MVLTSSLKIGIFWVGPDFFPAFKVSPVHGFASTVFSFLRSFIDPILSHPLVARPPRAGCSAAAESPSENIAIFGLPDLVFRGAASAGGCWACCCSLAGLDEEENGSVLAASAGRTLGNAGEVGPLS